MNKYKICVYAICKNEEKFVERWVNSVKEADEIYVLDTGSMDNTVEELKKRGVIVSQKEINPWRFDVARNLSLDMVPNDADICVCIDLDEVLEVGWRKKLEKIWNIDINRLRYNYNWSLDDKNNYKWIHPVHEVLKYTGNGTERFITTDDITVNHYPDNNKSRSNYLPLLELSVKESPNNDRNMHYLGREYMYYGRWNECIDTLINHLNLPSATWKDERSASMRFIARSYINLKRYDEARMWLDKAIREAPYLRDPYVERALLEYQLSNYKEVEKYAKEALKIRKHEKNYINEPFSWNHTIYDLLSISLFYQGKLEESLFYSEKALRMSPNDDRLIKNNKIIKEANKL